MKKAIFVFCLSLSAGFILHQPCGATRAFITDSFEEFTLRAGPGNEYRIVAMLSSGQALEILESQKEWSRIRIPGSDREGWVVSRYVMERQPWGIQATSLREENAALKTKLNQLEGTLNDSQRQRAELTSELQKTSKLLEETKTRYETLRKGSEGFVSLQKAHEKSEAALAAVKKDLETLSQEHERLQSSQMNRWVATGALILLCGLLLGVMVGRQQKSRRPFYS